MKYIFTSLFAFLLCINFASAAPATSTNTRKPVFYFGGYIDANINMHSASFTKLSNDFISCCSKYTSANGLGISFGGLFEYPISSDQKLLFGARLGYASLGADFEEPENIGNTEVRDANPPYEKIATEAAGVIHYLESSLNVINLNPYISYNLWNNLFISGGLNLGYLMSSSYDMREELDHPDNVVFTTNGTRTRNEANNQEIANVNTLQAGISAGLSYQVPIGECSFIIPEIRYNFALTNVSDVEWKANYLQLGLAIKFPHFRDAKVAKNMRYERDTIIEKRYDVKEPYIELVESKVYGDSNNSVTVEKYKLYQKATATLSADFKAFGVNNGQRQFNPTVVIEEFETTERFPTLPIVYFPDGDGNLANTRMNLITNSAAKNFVATNLKPDVMDIYYNMLNLVGKRLSDNPDAKVIVAGYSSGEGKDKDNANIWQTRAESVKNYLINVWGISDKQLTIEQGQIPQRNINPKSVNDAIEENRKVELITSNLNILEPLQLSQIERLSNPPQIEFETEIISEAGIDNYVLEVSQNNSEIRRFVGRAANDKLVWEIKDNPMPLLDLPVRAVFRAKDIIGQNKEVVQEIKIEQQTIKKKREKIESDMKVERYSLILFEYDKADISQLDKELIQNASNNIQPDSKIKISGYADRTGDSQYNKNLAKRRCEEVKKTIKVGSKNTVDIDAVGHDKLIFNNTLPEGRALSRTVRIEVRTPIKK